jgi:hypothetical protein
MKLWRSFSGSKPQSGEDGIGGGSLGLPPDPLLDLGQPLGGLMDVVAVGDVGEGFEQLLETFVAARSDGGCYDRRLLASRRAPSARFFDVSHPSAFPCAASPGPGPRSSIAG